MVLSAACLDLILGPVSPNSPHCQHPERTRNYWYCSNQFHYYQDRFATGIEYIFYIMEQHTFSNGQCLFITTKSSRHRPACAVWSDCPYCISALVVVQSLQRGIHVHSPCWSDPCGGRAHNRQHTPESALVVYCVFILNFHKHLCFDLT